MIFKAAALACLGVLIAARMSEPAQDAAVIKLLDAGQGEKREVRFKPVLGHRRTETLALQADMEMEVNGASEPKARLADHTMTVDITVAEISRDGDARYNFVFSKVQGDPSILSKALEGLTCRVTASDRGTLKRLDFKLPKGADRRATQVLESYKESLIAEFPFFPKEPIGVGAAWEANFDVDLDVLKLRQKAAYKVLWMGEEAVKLHVDVTQSAGGFEIPVSDAGTKVFVESISTKGSGDITWETAWSHGASTGSFEIMATLKMREEKGGAVTRGSLTMDLKVRQSSSDKDATAIRGLGPRALKTPAAKVIDPWATQMAGAWFRFKTSAAGEESFTDTGLKAQEGSYNLLASQKFDKAGAGPEEEVRMDLAPVKILGSSTLQIQGRDYPCEIQEIAAGERRWVIKEGRFTGAVLKAETSKGTLTTRELWEHVLRIKGREFECLVVESEWKSGEKVEGIKTWFSPATPMGALREERQGVSKVLVDFGGDWSRRPAFPGSAPGKK